VCPLPCRRVVAALAVLVSTLLSAGCGTFDESLTYREHGYGDASIGDLHVRAVRLVKSADDRSVAVLATFVNYAPPDVLSEVTVWPGDANGTSGTVTAYKARPGISLETDGVERVGGPGDPRIHMPDPQRRIRAGYLAIVTLIFSHAGMAEVEVIVDEPEGYLAPYAPPPTASRAPAPHQAQ
jgi:hypothetical protein